MLFRNFKYIRYSLRHWFALNRLAIHTGTWHFRFLLHDLDKVLLYCVTTKDKASAWHRQHSKHHVRDGHVDDPLQAVLDWECARFTKPDKPLDAFETWQRYYPEVREVAPYIRRICGKGEER